MPVLTSFGSSEGTGVEAVRIVRSKLSREWFVEDHGVAICSLIQTDISPARWLLRSDFGNWEIQKLGVTRLQASSMTGKPRQAEIRAGVSKSGAFGEEPETHVDLYIDLRTYKRVVIGTGWKVMYQNQEVFRYSLPWRESDTALRVCYNISPKGQMPIEHRDLLFTMPLFWSGMSSYENVS